LEKINDVVKKILLSKDTTSKMGPPSFSEFTRGVSRKENLYPEKDS
jgi:hypothetical protein